MKNISNEEVLKSIICNLKKEHMVFTRLNQDSFIIYFSNFIEEYTFFDFYKNNKIEKVEFDLLHNVYKINNMIKDVKKIEEEENKNLQLFLDFCKKENEKI